MAKDKLSAAPLDAYRKEQKKREKKAIKDRREHGKLTKTDDTRVLQEKIRKLEDDDMNGKLDGAGRKRKQELEEALRQAKKRKAELDAEAKAREDSMPKTKEELDAMNKELFKNPEQSIHYHPIFNPYGVAPPGYNANNPNPFTSSAMGNAISGQPPLPLGPRPRLKNKNRPPLPKDFPYLIESLGEPAFRPPPPPPSMRPPAPVNPAFGAMSAMGIPPPPPPPPQAAAPPVPPPTMHPGPPLRPPPPPPVQQPPPPPPQLPFEDDDELRVRSLIPAALRVQQARGQPRVNPPPLPSRPSGLSFAPVPINKNATKPTEASSDYNAFVAEMKELGAM